MANRVTQTKKYITFRGLQDRWSCSHMFIERQLKDDPAFPPYSRFGCGPKAQRRFVIADIEQYERSKVVERSAWRHAQFLTERFVASLDPPAEGSKIYWDNGHRRPHHFGAQRSPETAPRTCEADRGGGDPRRRIKQRQPPDLEEDRRPPKTFVMNDEQPAGTNRGATRAKGHGVATPNQGVPWKRRPRHVAAV